MRKKRVLNYRLPSDQQKVGWPVFPASPTNYRQNPINKMWPYPELKHIPQYPNGYPSTYPELKHIPLLLRNAG